jgi:hypothetical protein
LFYLLTVVYFRYGKVYLKALKSMIEKGEGYAKKEAERLTRILSGVSSKAVLLSDFWNLYGLALIRV